MPSFTAVADGVYLWRCPTLDVNSTLILGRERALLVDTLSTAVQAGELATGVAALTTKPVTVVIPTTISITFSATRRYPLGFP